MPISASLSIRYAGAVGNSFFGSVIINWDMSSRTSRPAYQFKSATETRGQMILIKEDIRGAAAIPVTQDGLCIEFRLDYRLT
jgi:hypothetical protein